MLFIFFVKNIDFHSKYNSFHFNFQFYYNSCYLVLSLSPNCKFTNLKTIYYGIISQ